MIHGSVTESNYQGLPGVRSTQLKTALRSVEVYRHEQANPRESTPTLEFGIAAHCLMLTPDVYAANYCTAPECDKRTKDGKATWEAFCAANEGKTTLDGKTAGKLAGMYRAMVRHPMAGVLTAGMTEVAVTFGEGDTAGKCRFDIVDRDGAWFVDYKTISRYPTPHACEAAIAAYGYHVQLAWYLRGLRANWPMGGLDRRAGILWQMTEPPYTVLYSSVDDAALATGDAGCANALERIVAAGDDTVDYPNGIMLSLPRWYGRGDGVEVI